MIAIYTRLSKQDDLSNSIQNQLREGQEFANGRPYTHYNEGEGISGGAKKEDRPELMRLLNDIENKKISIVWFRTQDRLERNIKTFFDFAQVAMDYNVQVFVGTNPTPIDFANPNDEFMSGIFSMFNSYLIKKQSYLTRKSLRDNRLKGYIVGTHCYGYDKKSPTDQTMVIDEKQAEIVKKIFNWSLQGWGHRRIANQLTEDKVPPPKSRWSDGGVRSILKNTTYMGIRRTTKDFGETYTSPIIIEPFLFRKVQDNFKKNMTSGPKLKEHPYLLNGIAVCAKCGKPVTGRALPNQNTLYRCVTKRKGKDHCGNGTIQYEMLNNVIWNLYFKQGHIMRFLEQNQTSNKKHNIEKQYQNKISKLKQEIESIENKKNNLAMAIAERTISKDDAKITMNNLNDTLLNAQSTLYDTQIEMDNHINHMTTFITDYNDLKNIKDNISFEEQKGYIHKYIKEITFLNKSPKKGKHQGNRTYTRYPYQIGITFNFLESFTDLLYLNHKYIPYQEPFSVDQVENR
ncbi:recombinase family protein [Mangrovimonas sp. DI 80]|uniref:recombinase family protein n=1 Tax=Mangrovimonas sp. DI 80 TaxID=1779330 RepID=UPI0009770550|nr:recombinase family protein [Mangrovimonas sp. DI 80]OMP29735.1 hypothetical protein BKM32_15655 [Mangrovimonas sp. DI 80]